MKPSVSLEVAEGPDLVLAFRDREFPPNAHGRAYLVCTNDGARDLKQAGLGLCVRLESNRFARRGFSVSS